MKSHSLIRFFFAGACALLTFGCSTKESRIKEKAAEFAALTPEQQQVIRGGFVAIGFTPDMVYMALDKPERVVPGSGPGEETWIYHNFYSADGNSIAMGSKVTTSSAAGGVRGGNPNAPGNRPQNNTFQVDYDPAAENIKAESAIKVHVKFTAGKVSDIQIVNDGKA